MLFQGNDQPKILFSKRHKCFQAGNPSKLELGYMGKTLGGSRVTAARATLAARSAQRRYAKRKEKNLFFLPLGFVWTCFFGQCHLPPVWMHNLPRVSWFDFMCFPLTKIPIWAPSLALDATVCHRPKLVGLLNTSGKDNLCLFSTLLYRFMKPASPC